MAMRLITKGYGGYITDLITLGFLSKALKKALFVILAFLNLTKEKLTSYYAPIAATLNINAKLNKEEINLYLELVNIIGLYEEINITSLLSVQNIELESSFIEVIKI